MPVPPIPGAEEISIPEPEERPLTETASESSGSQRELAWQRVPEDTEPPAPPTRQARSIGEDVHLATRPSPPHTPRHLPALREPRRPWFLTKGRMLVFAVVVLLLMEGWGLLYYATVSHPGELHAVATDTARILLTGQAQSTAQVHLQTTGTAQAYARATARVQATATAQAVATATAREAVYTSATRGSPILQDPLTNNDSNLWTVGTFINGSCAFTGGALHVNGKTFCLAQATNFRNFAYQAQETFLTKGSVGGIMFRVDIANQRTYFFDIGATGSYALATIQVNNSGENSFHVVIQGWSPAVKKGVNRSNLLTVVARGSTISLYINGQYVAQLSDRHSSVGAIGVFSYSSGTAEEVTFTNAQVWQL